MNWNEYQEAIFERTTKDRSSHFIINGVAGCGKTTTLEEISRKIPQGERSIFLAFNKSIAEELATRLRNSECRTFNSIGAQICRRELGYTKLNTRKVQNIFRFDFMKFEKSMSWEQKKRINDHCEAIARIIGILKGQINPVVEDQWKEIASEYGIDTPDESLCSEAIPFCWQASLEQQKVIDFNDQLFFPIFCGWKFPTYDNVLVDEVQDLNEVQREMVMLLAGERNQDGRTSEADGSSEESHEYQLDL